MPDLQETNNACEENTTILEEVLITDKDTKYTSKFGGRKFLISMFVILFAFLISVVYLILHAYFKKDVDVSIVMSWVQIASNIISFYLGYKLTSNSQSPLIGGK